MKPNILFRNLIAVYLTVIVGVCLTIYLFNDQFNHLLLETLGLSATQAGIVGAVLMITIAFIVQRLTARLFYGDPMFGLESHLAECKNSPGNLASRAGSGERRIARNHHLQRRSAPAAGAHHHRHRAGGLRYRQPPAGHRRRDRRPEFPRHPKIQHLQQTAGKCRGTHRPQPRVAVHTSTTTSSSDWKIPKPNEAASSRW